VWQCGREPLLQLEDGHQSIVCNFPSQTVDALMDATAVWVVAVVFVATLIRSAFGFGEALVAVPLLALFLPVRTAAPLAVLVSITIAAVVVAQDWRKIHVRSVGWLVVSTMIGTPVGLMLLASRHQRAVMVTWRF